MTKQSMVMDAHREQWRCLRKELHLVDPTEEGFACGGPTRFLDAPSVRMLVLPSGTDATHIEFDPDFWAWWLPERPDPASGHPTQWGNQGRPTASAALKGVSRGDQENRRYLALCRNGALDMGLGSDGMYATNEFKVFRLIVIIGRAWSALDLYREAVEHFAIQGPWELTLALAKTEGATIGHFANGWAEPGNWLYSPPRCAEPGLLLRRELSCMPDTAGLQSLVFSLGAWLEDA